MNKHEDKYKRAYVIKRGNNGIGILLAKTRKKAREYILASKGRHKITEVAYVEALLSNNIINLYTRWQRRLHPKIHRTSLIRASGYADVFILSPSAVKNALKWSRNRDFNVDNIILAEVKQFFKIKED